MNISIICRRKRNKFIKIIIIFARTQPKALDWPPPVGTPFYLQPEQFLQFPVQDEGFLPRLPTTCPEYDLSQRVLHSGQYTGSSKRLTSSENSFPQEGHL